MPALVPHNSGRSALLQRDDGSAPTNAPTTTGERIGEETMVVKVGEEERNAATNPIPSEIPAPASTSSVDSVLAVATGQADPASGTFEQITGPSKVPDNGNSKPDSKPSDAAATEDDSTSAGTKAGIAFGVIGAALLIGWIIFYLFGRRKKSKSAHRKKKSVDTEKHAGRTHGKPAVVRTLATDVVADNRPVTTFFSRHAGVNKPLPVVDGVAPPPAAAKPRSRNASPDSVWDRPSTSHSTNSANPFGSYAERIHSPETPPMPSRSPSPIHLSRALPRGYSLAEFEPAAAVAPLAPLARKASLRKDAVAKLDLALPQPPTMAAVPGSPALTEYSMSSVAPGAAAAATDAPDMPKSTVHRVQQDFEPSMEDELELKAGQLVRLLHEFDDGWALCSRMDMSRQGVVPRTCISTRPLKPRSKSDARSTSPPSSRRPS